MKSTILYPIDFQCVAIRKHYKKNRNGKIGQFGAVSLLAIDYSLKKPPSYPPQGGGKITFFALSLKLTIRNQRKAPPRRGWGGLFALIFNIYSQLFGYYSPKNIFCKRSSTLPPHRCYILNNQYVIHGGIMGGIRVELHVIPP